MENICKSKYRKLQSTFLYFDLLKGKTQSKFFFNTIYFNVIRIVVTLRQQTETVDLYFLFGMIGGDQIPKYVRKYGLYQCDAMQQCYQFTIRTTDIHVIMFNKLLITRKTYHYCTEKHNTFKKIVLAFDSA